MVMEVERLWNVRWAELDADERARLQAWWNVGGHELGISPVRGWTWRL